MRPRVNVYPDKNYKGKVKVLQDEGVHSLKESFTQNELIGKTFYIIHPIKKGGKEYAVDNGGYDKQGGKFHLFEWSKDNINQIFTMLSNGVIKNVGNNLVMDVINGQFKNGTQLHNYPQNNTAAQLWTYDSNTKMLMVKGKPFCLNIHGYDIKNRAVLNIWTPNGHESQMWDIRLCEIKDGFSPKETFKIDFSNLLDLSGQRETFNTCQAILYQHTGGGGYNTGWMGIGDYGWKYFSSGKTGNGYAKNDDLSSIRLKPFTDIFVYQDRDFKGKVWHFHNGKNTEWLINLTDSSIKFNDIISSYKIRAGAIDYKQTKDNKDTSGNSVCTLRYKVHMAGSGWSGWINNGNNGGKQGNRMEAIMFEYSGPGQMYARAHVKDKGWLGWVSSGMVCGTTGQSRRLEAVQFKIDGASNVFFGVDVFASGKGWISNVGLNKVAGTTGQSRQIEAIKITVSLSEIKASSNKGRTISLASFPKNWVITDMSIGKFQSLIGKPFIIKSRGNNRFVIDTEGHQNGGGVIKIYQRVENFHVNQTWTVDKYGRLISWQNRNSILYCDNSRDGYRPTIVGIKGNESRANSTKAKWRFNDKNQIELIYQPNQHLDVKDAKYANNTPVQLWHDNGNNAQKWDIEVLQEKTSFPLSKEKNLVGKRFFLVHNTRGSDGKYYAIDNRGKIASKTEFYMYEWSKTNKNQMFTISENGAIKCVNGNTVLDVNGGKIVNNSTIIQYAPHGGVNQTWGYDNKMKNVYINSNKSFCLHAGAKEYRNGGKLVLYNCGNCNESKFWIVFEDGTAFNNNFTPKTKLTNNIGKFKDWVGKTIRISSKKCSNIIIDSRNVQGGRGGDAGRSLIGIWTLDPKAKANQEWQIDADGRIILAANKDWCIYASSMNNSTPLTLVKASTLNKYDMKQYWTYDGNIILNLGGSNKALDMDSKTPCKNGGQLHIYNKHGKDNQQWTVAEATVIEESNVGSLEISPMTDVIIKEESTEKGVKPKKIVFHNGKRYKMSMTEAEADKTFYRIPDISIYGIKNIKNIELKVAKNDEKQTSEVSEYEPFSLFYEDGTISTKAIILITCLITLCIFAFAFYMCSRNDNNRWGDDRWNDRWNDRWDDDNMWDSYIHKNKWMLSEW